MRTPPFCPVLLLWTLHFTFRRTEGWQWSPTNLKPRYAPYPNYRPRYSSSQANYPYYSPSQEAGSYLPPRQTYSSYYPTAVDYRPYARPNSYAGAPVPVIILPIFIILPRTIVNGPAVPAPAPAPPVLPPTVPTTTTTTVAPDLPLPDF